MNTRTPAPLPNSTIYGIFFGALVFVAIFLLNVASLVAEIQLSTKGEVVDAQIQEWATYGDPNHPESHSTDYEVQYSFDVDGETYTFSDATGRKNLWASIPKPDWELSQNTGIVPVVYNPNNPWKNHPQHPDEWPYGGPVAGMVITGSIAGFLLWAFVSVRKEKHRSL